MPTNLPQACSADTVTGVHRGLITENRDMINGLQQNTNDPACGNVTQKI